MVPALDRGFAAHTDRRLCDAPNLVFGGLYCRVVCVRVCESILLLVGFTVEWCVRVCASACQRLII